jgi:hypothetical protein
MPVISSKQYFEAYFKAQIVAFYQTRHLRLFFRVCSKKIEDCIAQNLTTVVFLEA